MNNAITIIFIIPLWLIFILTRFIKRDESIVVFGIHTKSFSGNVKALLLDKEKGNYTSILISSDKSVIEQANNLGIRSAHKLSYKGIYYSLKAATYIYSGFPSDINFWLSNGAKYINVWHGTPFKKIERDVETGRYSLRNKYKKLYGIFAPQYLTKPDIILASSLYEEECFKSAFSFPTEKMFRSFPPRLKGIRCRENKKLTVLYAPTWRDDQSYSITQLLDLSQLNRLLIEKNIIFNIKLHPSDKSNIDIKEDSNICFIDKNADIYEYLSNAELVISDYSSMIFEALYLNKEVHLYCPDYKNYLKNSRELYLKPSEDLPVSITYMQSDFFKWLSNWDSKKNNIQMAERFYPYPFVENLLPKLIKNSRNNR